VTFLPKKSIHLFIQLMHCCLYLEGAKIAVNPEISHPFTVRQTTSFNEFLNRGRHSASGKWRPPRHAGHIRAVRARSSRCFCFTTYSTPSFLHPYSFLTYSRSHSQATHLSALSLIKDCLAVRLMASFRSARFTSSASFVVPVVSSDSTVLLAYSRLRIEAA
jgi:hypothetical protein